jgi:C-terminal processing protease CtpA/Prc
MKKIALLLLILLFQFSMAQETISETNKLAATCKIWGFLKYYHPKVASGKTNIDQQLFDLLPQIEQAKNKEQFTAVIEKWIASLGIVPTVVIKKSKVKVDYFDKNFDLSWIDNPTIFSEKLSQTLRFIEKNRLQGKQFYICDNCGIKNETPLAIQNEIEYPNFSWDNRNLRLLTLFRYWNLVEYFCPNKYLMDINWNTTLTDMLPRFVTCESETNYYLTLNELVVRLNDSHASFSNMKVNERFGLNLVPVRYKIIDDKVVVTDFLKENLAKESDWKIGDVITKSGGKTILEIINEKKKYTEGSNYPTIIRNLWYQIFCGKEDTVEIEFIREGKTSTKTVKRYNASLLNIYKPVNESGVYELLGVEQNVAIINVQKITEKNIAKTMEELKNMKAIIFDARWYPSFEMNMISDYLNPEPKECYRFTVSDLSYPGKFIWGKNFVYGKNNPNYYKGKVVVLINENTQSKAECMVMMLQTAPNVTVIGSQTAGADGQNCPFKIMKGFNTYFTSQGVFYPNKKQTQRIGIEPDIEVSRTIRDYQVINDEVLNRAMKLILDGK